MADETEIGGRKKRERLNSPVDDGGSWPYKRTANVFPDIVTSVDEPADPMSFVPRYKQSRQEEE